MPGLSIGTTPLILSRYGALLRRRALLVALLLAACVLAVGADLGIGASSLGWREAWAVLLEPASHGASARLIVWSIRLPASLTAALVGAALALAGTEMQTILDNPLASPFTLGVSSAATLGAALAIVLGIGLPMISGNWLLFSNAFIFAFASVLLLQALTRLPGTGSETLVLFGIAMVFTFNALVALLQFVAGQEALQQLVFWTMGSLARADWLKTGIMAGALVVALPFSLKSSWAMTALRLGEDRARGFGVNVGRLRFGALLRISLLAATAVACAGTIGFIGLVAPHIARLMAGEDHRFLLPTAALVGALLLSLSSLASKALIPGVLMPVGLVTSLIGVPFFVFLILDKRRRM